VLAGMIEAKTRLHSRVIKAVTVGDIAQLYTDFEGTTVDNSGRNRREPYPDRTDGSDRRHPDCGYQTGSAAINRLTSLQTSAQIGHAIPILPPKTSPSCARLYEARGNPEVIRQVLAPDVRWESRRLPLQPRLCRARSGARTFLQTTLRRLEDWHTEPSEFYAANDRVFALDTYSARARATGRMFKARFAHVWTLRDAMIVRLQQCATTRNSRKRWAKIAAKVPAPVKRGGEIAGAE
jgi:ketosteroid isomerase-like protein